MGFDVSFVRSRFRDEMVERMNPFTGEVMSVRPPEPLTDSELQAVRWVLQRAGTLEPTERGHAAVRFEDGGSATVCWDGREEGCLVTLRRGLSPDCLRFLFDLFKAADWVMLPAMEGNPAIVSAPGLAGGFADSFPEVVCASPEELGAILSDGYDPWKRYRDQVVGEGRPPAGGAR
jgi:hypothetical protein